MLLLTDGALANKTLISLLISSVLNTAEDSREGDEFKV